MEQNYSFIKPKSINDTYTIKKYISLLKDNNINTGDSINKNNMKIVENYFDYVVDYNEKNIIYNKILTLLGKHIKNNNIFLYTKYFEDFSDFLFCDKTKSIYIGGFKTSNSYDIYLHRWIIYNNIDNAIIDVNNLFDGVFNESYSFERPKSINDTYVLKKLENEGIYTDAIVESNFISKIHDKFKMYNDIDDIDTYNKLENIIKKNRSDINVDDIAIYFYEIIKNNIYLITYCTDDIYNLNDRYLIININTESIIYKNDINESYSFERPISINDTVNHLKKLKQFDIYTGKVQNTDDYVKSINKLLNFYPNVIHKHKNADTEYFFNSTLFPILKTYNKFSIDPKLIVLSECIKINNNLYICFLLDYNRKYTISNQFIWIIVDTYNKKIIYNND